MKRFWKLFWIKWGEAQVKKINASRDKATLVYTDRFQNKWYAATPDTLHATRGLTAWILSDDIKYGLSKEKLLKGFKKITEFHNEGKMAEAAKIVGVLEAGLELYSIPEVLLNVASCYTYINDEPDEYKASFQKMKRDIWQQDTECRAFFLSFATEFTKKYSKSEVSNVLDYFRKVKPVLDQIEYRLT